MRSDENLALLFEDFPELAVDNVFWRKEIYAHFGLLFSGYALLEASLQNCLIFWRMAHFSRTGQATNAQIWEERFDREERSAFDLTLGNLIKALRGCPDMSMTTSTLTDLKKKRDYFAHRFFRQEAFRLESDPDIRDMIVSMNLLRRRVSLVEAECDRVGMGIARATNPRYWAGVDMQFENERLRRKLREEIAGSDGRFGWERT